MSYCRWSSDNHKSDVYTYHCVDGTWTTHVADLKRVGHIPDPPSFLEEINDDWMRRHQDHQDAVDKTQLVRIGLPYDGKTFRDASPAACAETLKMLRDAGYHVPNYAIEELEQEASETAQEL